jgi:hypothetical protein
MMVPPPTRTAERQPVRRSIRTMRRNTRDDRARRKSCRRYNRRMPKPAVLVVDEEPMILNMSFRALRHRIEKLGIE